MFNPADRMPVFPARSSTGASLRHWGLTRMAPYLKVSAIPASRMELDPVTQTGRCIAEDGTIIELGHRKSNTGTETTTSQCKGDGGDHKRYDQDIDQDSDQD